MSRTFIAVMAAMAMAINATADAPPLMRATLADPALDRAVAEAIESSPELKIARAQVEAAHRREPEARTLPDPSAAVSYDGDRRMVALTASQAFPWPGKLALAGQIAAADAAAIEAGAIGRARLSLETRVRNAYYDLALARSVEGLVEDRQHITAQVEDVARTRYAAGLAPQQDVLRAQIDLLRLGELQNQQRAMIAARSAELERLVGQSLEVREVVFDSTIPSVDALVAAAEERSPELAAAAGNAEAARARVAAAKKGLLPDFVVTAGPMVGTARTSFTVGAGVSLPMFRAAAKQRNEIAADEALAKARSAEIDAITRDIEIRTRERIASLDAAIRSAMLYRDKIVPVDRLAVESALAAYSAGKVPFITVHDAIHALHDDHEAYFERVVEAAKWRVAIDDVSLQQTSITVTPGALAGAGGAMSAPSM